VWLRALSKSIAWPRLCLQVALAATAFLLPASASSQVQLPQLPLPDLPLLPPPSPQLPQIPQLPQLPPLLPLPDLSQLPLVPALLPGCREITLQCVLDSVNILGGSVILRRNDLLLGLDLGLDRQIDLLTAANGETPSGRPSGLGGAGLPFAQPMYAVGAASHTRNPAIRPAFGIWTEGFFYRFDDDNGPLSGDGHSGVLYVGADYLVSNTILVGALVQFDQTDQDFPGLVSRVSNDGWMAGPYATVRLSHHLFFQGRAAWGASQNQISADPNIDDRFDSRRWLVRGTLLGQWQFGASEFRPRISVGYIEETRESYASSAGGVVGSVTGSLGQAKFGSELARKYALADGTVIEPSFLLEGIWNFDQSITSPQVDDLIAGPDLRGRAELGLAIVATTGVSFGASVSYDGIGSDFAAIGGRARVRVPFN
jgi:hypothetical protein